LPNSKSFQGLFEYFKIGYSTTIMFCLDWWVFELMVIIVGLFGEINEGDEVGTLLSG
jgi:hypothetical protein